MSVLNFDWNQIAYIGSPLMIPWWAEVHIFIGFVIFYWVLVPIVYYTDVGVRGWYAHLQWLIDPSLIDLEDCASSLGVQQCLGSIRFSLQY